MLTISFKISDLISFIGGLYDVYYRRVGGFEENGTLLRTLS